MENNEILYLLENDSRLTAEQLAVMLDKEVGEIKDMIKTYEKDGVILGYMAVVDWDKTDRERVNALIEVKVAPQRDRGFDKVAEKIYNYPEVQALFLMSGGFDLAVFVEAKNLKEIAHFVAHKLAVINDVTSTATHFILHKYKDNSVVYNNFTEDLRGKL